MHLTLPLTPYQNLIVLWGGGAKISRKESFLTPYSYIAIVNRYMQKIWQRGLLACWSGARLHTALCNLIQPQAVHVLALCKLAFWLVEATNVAPVRSRHWQIRGRDYTVPAYVAGLNYTALCVHWLQINMREAPFLENWPTYNVLKNMLKKLRSIKILAIQPLLNIFLSSFYQTTSIWKYERILK